jgi:predicted amidophosphoribosyltransferase
VQDGMTVEERQANTDGAIRARRSLAGRKVVIVDDVMTSGSTLAAATGACIDAGAAQVSVLVLARVGKTP